MKKNLIQIIKILKKLNFILDHKQKRKSVFVLVVILMSSCFELLGVTAILPFVQAVLTPDVLMENQIIKKIVLWLSIDSATGLLMLMGVGLILLYLFKNAFMVYSQYVQSDYATKIQKDLSVRMLHSYMTRPYTYFLDTNSAELLRGCKDDVDEVYDVLAALLTIVTESLTICLIALFIIYTDPIIAIGVLALMSVTMLAIVTVFKPRIKQAGEDNVVVLTEKNKIVNQVAAGIKEIFVMQRKNLFVQQYEDASETARKAKLTYATLSNCPDRIVEGVCVSGILGIVCIRLGMSDASTMEFIPKLGAFAMAAFKIFPSIGKLINRMNVIAYNIPGFNNVYDTMQRAEEYATLQKEYMEGNRKAQILETQDVSATLDFREQVSIEHVCWKYDRAKRETLSDVNMTIAKGQAVAFIGSSGAGKTTLADIILGLLRPQDGSVTMDGIDIHSIPSRWSKIVGYVPQTIFLIDDTVRRNISFGLPEDKITDEGIWDALERAQLAEFIRSLPNGLDTIVGERGVKFSGGQRQRIAIARALYNKPEILILDEATAALDNETETAVMESIDALQGQITMIIVAHRLTTIRNCDKIYEIKDGRAVLRTKEEVFGQ